MIKQELLANIENGIPMVARLRNGDIRILNDEESYSSIINYYEDDLITIDGNLDIVEVCTLNTIWKRGN